MRGKNPRDVFGRIKSLIKNNLTRVIIYTLLVAICLTAFFVVKNIRESNALKQQSVQSVTAREALEKRKTDYQALGMDVTAVQDKLSKIYEAIYGASNYTLADSLIGEANAQLDELYARYLADKQVKAQDLLKGDLIGNITCSGAVCKSAVKLSLSISGDALATTGVDQTGNYVFHVLASSYNLSVSSSGYKSAVKTNVSVVSQKQTTVNLNLDKIATSSKSSGSTPAGGSGTTTTGSSPQVIQLFDLINSYRQSNGLSKLALDSLLNNAATSHSSWMLSSGNFSHIGENGSQPWDRCIAAGTTCSSEIIYQGSSGPNGAFDSWKNSPPHNAIMLGGSFSAMGIGIAGKYYTVDFR